MATGRERVIARLQFDLHISADHPSLPGHFPGNPVVPGVLLLDSIVHGIEEATGRRAVRLEQIKFLAVLRPEEPVFAVCDVDGETATFHAYSRWGTATVALASGAVSLPIVTSDTRA